IAGRIPGSRRALRYCCVARSPSGDQAATAERCARSHASSCRAASAVGKADRLHGIEAAAAEIQRLTSAGVAFASLEAAIQQAQRPRDDIAALPVLELVA